MLIRFHWILTIILLPFPGHPVWSSSCHLVSIRMFSVSIAHPSVAQPLYFVRGGICDMYFPFFSVYIWAYFRVQQKYKICIYKLLE